MLRHVHYADSNTMALRRNQATGIPGRHGHGGRTAPWERILVKASFVNRRRPVAIDMRSWGPQSKRLWQRRAHGWLKRSRKAFGHLGPELGGLRCDSERIIWNVPLAVHGLSPTYQSPAVDGSVFFYAKKK